MPVFTMLFCSQSVRSSMLRCFVLSVVGCMGLLCRSTVAAESVDYARNVYPILEKYCVGCHSADESQGGLAMDDFASFVKGGESGPAFTAGSSASSRMLMMAAGKLEPVMPPDDAEGPNEQELELLSRWVDQGATGPDGDMPIKRSLQTPQIKPSPGVAQPITAIAISQDGNRTARAKFGSIQIADSQGNQVEINDNDLGKINSLAFSRDSSRLIVASGLTGAYGRAAIYETQSGQLEREFVGHRDTIYAAVLSPDESILATAGYDRTIVLWDAKSGEILRELTGHNGAIFDLAFSPDGKVLVSACADETAKVWNVASGVRLDTLSQPEGEVFAVDVTRDGRFIVAGSGDNRIRVWRLMSTDSPRINPLVATRFVDETPIVNFAISPDNRSLVAVAESGNIKVVRTSDWQPVASLDPLGESATDLFITGDSRFAKVSLMNGEFVSRELPNISPAGEVASDSGIQAILMDLGEPKLVEESALGTAGDEQLQEVDRNVTINGLISQSGEVDVYRWRAGKGEVWAIDADAVQDGRLDPIVTILDAQQMPVLRVRLQAVRDSYFTFRGKDSDQVNDFRVFNWQEMRLSEYLYAAGEVTRLQMHPRGPDSGFDMYPGEGTRWTYFGTSGTTHALGEPAYIVRPLPAGAQPLANGLPVFDVTYENDDDPRRVAGKNSRLLFTAPADGLYSVRIGDTRGEGGSEYGYRLSIRASEPGFKPSTETISRPLHPAVGREFRVRVDRVDGYEGEVTFEVDGLPDRLASNFPITIEAGQRFATGMIWADPNEQGWEGEIEPKVTAWAMINGRRVERPAGSLGKVKFDPSVPEVVPIIKPAGAEIGPHERWTLKVRRGETVSARVIVERKEGFSSEVSFGNERSGKNASQGVYVDNIGLNGLLIVEGATEREFFVTADETSVPGVRSFFLTANVDGGLTTHPIEVEVLP